MNVSASYYDWWFRYEYEQEQKPRKGQASLTSWIHPKRVQKTKKRPKRRVPTFLWEGWVVWWDGKQERFEQEHTDKMDEIIAWVTRTCNEIIANGGTLLDWGWHMF